MRMEREASDMSLCHGKSPSHAMQLAKSCRKSQVDSKQQEGRGFDQAGCTHHCIACSCPRRLPNMKLSV